MHVDVFCYGTLRTRPDLRDRLNASAQELSKLGMLDIQMNFDPDAEIIGELGGWRLKDRAIFCDDPSRGVPAVSNWQVEGHEVVGDLYRVTLAGFAHLLRYEGWPTLYEYEVVHVVSTGSPVEIHEAVVFTTSRADNFGAIIPNGDYFAPRHQEVQCAE